MQATCASDRQSNGIPARENERGQTLVEYSLILLLVALVVIVPVTQIGATVLQLLTSVVGGF